MKINNYAISWWNILEPNDVCKFKCCAIRESVMESLDELLLSLNWNFDVISTTEIECCINDRCKFIINNMDK